MSGRFVASLLAATTLFLAALPAAAAPQSASLCNAEGKVQVMSEKLDIDCAGGPAEEQRALRKARAVFQGGQLEWQTRAMIQAKIDKRIRDLGRELRRTQS